MVQTVKEKRMALTAKKVYAILKRQISDMEAKLNSPVRYRGTVATADLLPLNPDIGDMYNIESKSIYGEAGMNVAWNGVVWDTMGAPIDMSLYFTKEEANTTIQNMVNEYLEKNPVKPGATTEQAQQIEQNKTDVASLKTETSSLKEDKVDKPSAADNGKIPRAKEGGVEWVEVGQPTDEQTNSAVSSWLNEHPEATTTVQDRSLTMDKMVIGTFGYVTPEMFGAKGDGITDDTDAIKKCFDNGLNILFELNKTYLVHNKFETKAQKIEGNNSILKYRDKDTNAIETLGFLIVKSTSIYISNLTIDFESQYMYRPNTHFYLIYSLTAIDDVCFENSNFIITEDKYHNPYHIFTTVANNNIFKNCTFKNMTTGNMGGCLWVDLAKNECNQWKTIIENCVFESTSNDELLAFYGKKNLATIKNTIFNLHPFLKKNSIHLSLYGAEHDAVFENCCFNLSEDNTSGISAVLRILNGSSATIKHCNFDVENAVNLICDNNSSAYVSDSKFNVGYTRFIDGANKSNPKNMIISNTYIRCHQISDYITNAYINVQNCTVEVIRSAEGSIRNPFKTRADNDLVMINNCVIKCDDETGKTELKRLINAGESCVYIRNSMIIDEFKDTINPPIDTNV